MSFDLKEGPSMVAELLNGEHPLIEESPQASFTINSFYGQKNKVSPPNKKVPFYLRYSQGSLNSRSNNNNNNDNGSPLKDVQNHDSSEKNQKPEPSDEENKTLKSVSASKRPCYYQASKEKKQYVTPPKHFSSSSSLNQKNIENIGSIMPQTPSPDSHSMTSMSTKNTEERKFFKNRNSSATSSNSEGTIVSGTAVIKRGFNLSFVPRRLSSSFNKKEKIVRKRPFPAKKKRNYNRNNNNGLIEEPLSPLSKVFPELDLDSVCPSTPSSTSETEIVPTLEQVEDPVQISARNLEIMSSSTCGSNSCISISSDSESNSQQSPKYFSIFSSNRPKLPQQSCLVRPSESSVLMPRFIKDSENLSQMTLDAGQKKLGAIQCPQCAMVYTHADPLDEATHAKFHFSVLAVLKFPGWKKERVVQEYPELASRIIMVLPDDHKYAIQKVKEINEMMGQELGFPDTTLSFCRNYKVFLYISQEKRIEGCCIAESITKGYRVIPNNLPTVSGARRPWCCQTEPEPAAIGISKIWVYGPSRRNGVASKMLDCVRFWFEYGIPVERDQLAFSDPTPDGMQMATNYTGTPSFLVYKCQFI